MKSTSQPDNHRPQQNTLFAALSDAECERVAQDLDREQVTRLRS